MDLLPLFHRVQNQRVLIFGGGAVALQKIKVLLPTGPDITVVSPEVHADLRIHILKKEIRWLRQEFDPELIATAELVIGATNDESVNLQISVEAQGLGIPVNIVDNPELCTFFFGSIERYGPVTIGISTSGKCPALSKRVRKYISSIPLLRQTKSLFDLVQLRKNLPPKPSRKKQLKAAIQSVHESNSEKFGTVYIVGAGAGGFENLTLKAFSLIREADCVFYDALVDKEILDLIESPSFFVGKRKGTSGASQESIHQMLKMAASKNRIIVRLHGGDPMIFGRGAEEIIFLRKNGIPHETVSGISAFQQAAATTPIALTHRGVSRGIQIITGQTKDGDYNHVPRFQMETTYAVYMGVTKSEELLQVFSAQGFPSNLPVAIIENAGRSNSREFYDRLSNLPRMVEENEISSPAVILLGYALDVIKEKSESKSDFTKVIRNAAESVWP